MKPQKKVTTRQQAEEQQSVTSQQTKNQSELEFASVEDMLRHDALHTPVPPAIAHRLQSSLEQLQPTARPSWWRRIFRF
jgi:hypothetical protein